LRDSKSFWYFKEAIEVFGFTPTELTLGRSGSLANLSNVSLFSSEMGQSGLEIIPAKCVISVHLSFILLANN
jgi:hypothetical protein